ncbi:unnamed protein product [Rhizophagus irregularis]|nr:unnamed protein product [Rhizophagus irregularis]
MSELKSNNFLYGTDISKLARIFGFTKDPYLDDYILVMECASGGDLSKYLQKKFTEIDWQRKLDLFSYISRRLSHIIVEIYW